MNFTSFAVNSSPLCHLTPCRSLSTQWRPSSDMVWLSASAGRSFFVLPVLVLVEPIVHRPEDVRLVVARGEHRNEIRRRRPGGEGRRAVGARAFDGPVLGVREEHRIEGRGIIAVELRVHGDHVLRVEQDRHRLGVIPALLETADRLHLGLLVPGARVVVECLVELRIVHIVEVLAVRRQRGAAEQVVRHRRNRVVVIALEIGVPPALRVRLALAGRASRDDDRERHEALRSRRCRASSSVARRACPRSCVPADCSGSSGRA